MSQRIFVLDDDENSCQLAKIVLEKAGFEVQTQTKAIGATNAIRSFSPDLVLLDVMMPAVSGGSIAEILQRTLKDTPKIVFYSNKSNQELRELCEQTGADGFVCKVDGPTSLVKTIKEALEG